ncbi:MAG: class I SAM-dependent methyltransferase [Bacillota bacterium]|nr:class I SAM-dependent methyltransferase [Bacillota bacterium]
MIQTRATMDIEEYANCTNFYSNQIPELLQKNLSQKKWMTLLDLGCGHGPFLYELNKTGQAQGKKVIGVDLSENRIKEAKKINHAFNFYVDSACELKHIADKSIDFIVTSQVIEHVPNDQTMLKEIFRVLEVDGLVYLSTVYKRWYGWYFYRCNNKWALDPTHVREYTADEQLLSKINESGLTLLEMRKTLIKYPLSHFLLRIVKYKKTITPKYLELFNIIRVPIIGYYNWELILIKKEFTFAK